MEAGRRHARPPRRRGHLELVPAAGHDTDRHPGGKRLLGDALAAWEQRQAAGAQDRRMGHEVLEPGLQAGRRSHRGPAAPVVTITARSSPGNASRAAAISLSSPWRTVDAVTSTMGRSSSSSRRRDLCLGLSGTHAVLSTRRRTGRGRAASRRPRRRRRGRLPSRDRGGRGCGARARGGCGQASRR